VAQHDLASRIARADGARVAPQIADADEDADEDEDEDEDGYGGTPRTRDTP
jgi:hypothetical protein